MGSENNNGAIQLKDNSDKDMSESQGQENKESTSEGSSWYEKPEGLGNSVGGKVQETLEPVSQKTGPVLETVGKPVGGLVEPLVGGIMKGGKAWGTEVGVGYGNAEGGPAKQAEAEGQKMKEPFGGKEQNADNPLGL